MIFNHSSMQTTRSLSEPVEKISKTDPNVDCLVSSEACEESPRALDTSEQDVSLNAYEKITLMSISEITLRSTSEIMEEMDSAETDTTELPAVFEQAPPLSLDAWKESTEQSHAKFIGGVALSNTDDKEFPDTLNGSEKQILNTIMQQEKTEKLPSDAWSSNYCLKTKSFTFSHVEGQLSSDERSYYPQITKYVCLLYYKVCSRWRDVAD